MSNDAQRTPEEIALLAEAGLSPDGVTPLETPADETITPTPAETVVDTPAPNPETPAAVVPPLAPVVQTYEYQPTDESGRPIGGRQVIKYTTQEELTTKLTEQNTLLIRKLREETRNNRLGILTDETAIPDDAQRRVTPLVLKPKQLSDEQRASIALKIHDPESFDTALDEALEARMGAKPSAIADSINSLQETVQRQEAIAESQAFMAANPDYYRCNENGQAIALWCEKRGLAPVRANFQKAYETLKVAGVLVTSAAPAPPAAAPVAAPVVTPPAAAPVAAPVVTPPAVAPRPGIGSGLTRENSTPGEIPAPKIGEDIFYDEPIKGGQVKRWTGLQALDRMPSEVYKHRIRHEKGFADKVDKLEATRGKKK